MKQKKVLVTGGTGLVGSYLIRYLLQKNYTVKAIKRKTSPMDLVAEVQHQVEWVEGDILDVPFLEKIMQDIQQVYHAAAMISFDPHQAQRMLQVNKDGTANIVNTALYYNIEKLVHVSSIAALGRKEYQPNIDEVAQWENTKENSNYAISKFKAEAEVWRGIQEGLNAAIINPAVILGAGFWDSGSCKIFDRVAQGLKYYPGGTTGFVDVRDVASSAIALMESDISAERYIVSADNWPYQKLLTHLAKNLNLKPPTKAAPQWIVQLMAKAEWLRSKLFHSSPLLTKETIRNLQSTYYYNNNKIKNDLGFQFLPLEQTIKETAQTYTASQNLKRNFGLLKLTN
jgi:nucleoside-diphosphate-sugar epimerase